MKAVIGLNPLLPHTSWHVAHCMHSATFLAAAMRACTWALRQPRWLRQGGSFGVVMQISPSIKDYVALLLKVFPPATRPVFISSI